MDKLEKIFLKTEMTWKRVLLLSIITAVAVGLLMIPDFLDDTSFQNPGATVEFWIMWALFIILNCKQPLEAGIKTFIAFLISQPLIYLVQVPFSWRGWDIFSYYEPWFIMTLLTLPGGIIAWYVKKGNALSVAILSVANAMLCGMIPYFFLNMTDRFPRHLLTVIFIIAEVIFFILLLIKERKKRLIAFIIAAVLLIASSLYTGIDANHETSMLLEAEGEAPYEIISEHEHFRASARESFIVIEYKASDIKGEGTETVVYTDGSGEKHEIEVIYNNGSLYNDD